MTNEYLLHTYEGEQTLPFSPLKWAQKSGAMGWTIGW